MNCPKCGSANIMCLGKCEPPVASGRTDSYIYECRECFDSWEYKVVA